MAGLLARQGGPDAASAKPRKQNSERFVPASASGAWTGRHHGDDEIAMGEERIGIVVDFGGEAAAPARYQRGREAGEEIMEGGEMGMSPRGPQPTKPIMRASRGASSGGGGQGQSGSSCRAAP
jgi:hypothetical protein